MTDASQPAEITLSVRAGHTVRLIGGTPDIESALASVLTDVTVTTLASEAADVGIIVVEDQVDLRERLFTELDGLTGATQVWILTQPDTGPDRADISATADLASWHLAGPERRLADRAAVRLEKDQKGGSREHYDA